MFHFIITFLKHLLDMCETKAVVISISLILQVAANFCIYQAYTENNVGHHSGTKVKVLVKKSSSIVRIVANAII